MIINEMQQRAVMHKDGPMLVLAGPGSGKTLVITERVKYLIKSHCISENNILVVTYTRAAAEEMKRRFLLDLGVMQTGACFGTFHSVFFMMLKDAYKLTPANIIGEEERIKLLREIACRAGMNYDEDKELITELMAEISKVKTNVTRIEKYVSVNYPTELFGRIYAQYNSCLKKAGLMDFDDILIYCLDLLCRRADILAKWQDRFRYILIDEFQDINPLQYIIIRKLSGPAGNLFAVGDDDQSIYGFRGARPEIMQEFAGDYKGCPILLLDRNYRSATDIIKAADRLISVNRKRFVKEVKPVLDITGRIYITEFATMAEQNIKVIEEIQMLKKQGIPYSEMAVLVRTNIGLGPVVNKLMEYNIPFTMKDKLSNLYDHWIGEDLAAYMRIAAGSRERRLFLRVINRPKRYIGRECFSSPEVDLQEVKRYYKDEEWMQRRIEQLEYDLHILSKMTPYAAINYIRKGIGYDDYLNEYAAHRSMDPGELLDMIGQMQENSRGLRTIKEWFTHIEAYKEELARQSAKRKIREKNRDMDSVMLATMHGAKGLEFTAVFIIDANEGITPHKKAVQPSDIEEERRLFYVAMTRAREYLYISSSNERYNKHMKRSRFIPEILKVDEQYVRPDFRH